MESENFRRGPKPKYNQIITAIESLSAEDTFCLTDKDPLAAKKYENSIYLQVQTVQNYNESVRSLLSALEQQNVKRVLFVSS